jgi:hypothetical protein
MISWSLGNRFPVQSLQSQRSLAMHCLEAVAEIPSSARQDVPMHLGAGRRRNLDLAHSVPMCMFWWSFRPKIHGGSWWILGLCWFGSLPAEDIELGQSETCLETNMDSFQIHGVNLSESAVFWRQWSWLGPHIFWNQVSRWHHFKLLQVEWPTHLVSLDLLKMHRLFALFYPPMLETLLGTCSMLDPWCRSKISTRCFPLHAGQAQQWEADRFSQLT